MIKFGKDETKCSGCRICEMVCALQNFGECNPKKSFIRVRGHFPEPGGYTIEIRNCTLCGECLKYCPTGALFERVPEEARK